MPDSRDSATATPDARRREALELLDRVVSELEPVQKSFNVAAWDASLTGSAADAERRAELDATIRKMLARPEVLARTRAARASGGTGDVETDRQLEVLE